MTGRAVGGSAAGDMAVEDGYDTRPLRALVGELMTDYPEWVISTTHCCHG